MGVSDAHARGNWIYLQAPRTTNFKLGHYRVGTCVEETVEALLTCFMLLPELEIAFPRSFELMDNLESLMASIKAGASQSSPSNTALIVLHYTAEMLNDLE
jgi:hypothetical protein